LTGGSGHSVSDSLASRFPELIVVFGYVALVVCWTRAVEACVRQNWLVLDMLVMGIAEALMPRTAFALKPGVPSNSI